MMRVAHHSTILGRAQRDPRISRHVDRISIRVAHHSTILGRVQRDPRTLRRNSRLA
jgi:hypothetical protein